METETDMETKTETDNTGTWTWPHKRTWKWIWNASEISWRNFQWHYIFVAPLHNENNDMKI